MADALELSWVGADLRAAICLSKDTSFFSIATRAGSFACLAILVILATLSIATSRSAIKAARSSSIGITDECIRRVKMAEEMRRPELRLECTR